VPNTAHTHSACAYIRGGFSTKGRTFFLSAEIDQHVRCRRVELAYVCVYSKPSLGEMLDKKQNFGCIKWEAKLLNIPQCVIVDIR